MTFKEKVQSMTAKEIVIAMIDGLENPDTEIDMSTYGRCEDATCFGCAATNAVAKIMGYHWTPETIQTIPEELCPTYEDRQFFQRFENAIDCLRMTDFYGYNSVAKNENFAQVEIDDLPALRNRYHSGLNAWKEYAETL